MNRPDAIFSTGDYPLLSSEIADLLPFADLTPDQIQDLLSAATVHRVAPNKTFFDEGETAENFFVLLNGVLRVVRTTQDGDQVIVLHIAPGEMFGIAKAFESENYTMTARAASQGLALSWPSALWDKFIHDYPGFQSATRKAIGARMSELQDKLVSMAT